MWDDLHQKVINHVENDFSLSANIVLSDGFNWWITAVYDPPKEKIEIGC